MRKLSDYQGDAAIELWADLIEPIAKIIADDSIAKTYRTKPRIEVAKEILKLHKDEATEILTRIDPTPLTGLNIVVRLLELLLEIENAEELKGFFVSAGQAMTGSEFSGSVMENTGDVEN